MLADEIQHSLNLSKQAAVKASCSIQASCSKSNERKGENLPSTKGKSGTSTTGDAMLMKILGRIGVTRRNMMY